MSTVLQCFAQGKKPTLMILPSDNWCSQRYFMTEFDNQGSTVKFVSRGNLADTSAELSVSCNLADASVKLESSCSIAHRRSSYCEGFEEKCQLFLVHTGKRFCLTLENSLLNLLDGIVVFGAQFLFHILFDDCLKD